MIERMDVEMMDDLVRFARIEVDSRDVEPWAELIRHIELPRAQRCWLMTLYNTYDDLHSAWSVMRRWPSIADWAAADDREDVATYNCTQERRSLRGGRVIHRFASYAASLNGRGEESWMRGPLDWAEPSALGENFSRLTRQMRQDVWGVGRQSAFEWAEFAGKVLGLPVDAADGQLWESSGPRRCLERLFYLHNPSMQELDQVAALARSYIASAGVPLRWVDFETIICDFNVMRDGRYYPGAHLAALREEIVTTPDRRDRELLEAAWYTVIPYPWSEIDPGINRARKSVYSRTGEMLTCP